MVLDNFYFNAYISKYANKNDILKKYLITPIKLVDNCYVINIDNFTYYINTKTLLINKYENNNGTYLLNIHCDFEEITDDIFTIDFDNL